MNTGIGIYLIVGKTAAVVQWVRTFATHAEDWMYESLSQ